MGKTGTTALQDFFWTNRDKLSERGIHYPEIGVVERAHHLLSPYRPPYLKAWAYLNYEEWIPEFLKVPESNILISSELFCFAPEESESLSEFYNKVSTSFDIKIIVYLRRQDNVIWANYNQLIKAGNEKWLIQDVLDRLMTKFDYEKLLDSWKILFGIENIIVRPYERQQFRNGNIVDDLLYAIFGIDDTDGFDISRENNNPRLSLSALEFKRLINNLLTDIDDSGRFNDLLLEYSEIEDKSSSEIFASNSPISPANRLIIMDRFKQSNSNVARDYLGRADGELFYEPLPDSGNDWEEHVVSDDMLRDVAKFICERSPDLFAYLRRIVKYEKKSIEGNVLLAANKMGQIIEV